MLWNIFTIKLYYIWKKFKIKNKKICLPTTLVTKTNVLVGVKFLGYRLLTNFKKYVFFSHIKTLQNFNKKLNYRQQKRPFRRLIKLSRKKDFILILRVYFQQFFGLPNRIPKISNFFRLFYTWNGKDIAYFYHQNLLFTLIKLGLALNLKQSTILLHNNWVFVNGTVFNKKWTIITNCKVLQIIYNQKTLLYFKKIKKMYFKLKKKLFFLQWNEFKKMRKKQKSNFYLKNVHNFVFGVYWASLTNKCFLTLTFCLWNLPFTYSKWYYFTWINWLNFNSHNWKYLSTC